MEELCEIFGKKIRTVRRERDLTQEHLSELSGLSLQYIGEIERGKRNPSLSSIQKLAEALMMPVSSLFDIEEFQVTVQDMRTFLEEVVQSAEDDQIRTLYSLVRLIIRQSRPGS